MALKWNFGSKLCLEWITEKPLANAPRFSPTFTLLGSKCKLELTCYKDYGGKWNYSLILLHGTGPEKLKNSFYVCTFHSDIPYTTNYDIPPAIIRHRILVEKGEQFIYRFKENSFVEIKGWIFLFVFDFPEDGFQIKNDPVHTSTQTGEDWLPKIADTCVQDAVKISPDMEQLSDDFFHLLEKKVFPDVNLSCGGQVIPAHRSILAARSEVFEAMFRNKMVERETSSVDIKDLEVSVLGMLLRYMYSGKLPGLSDDTAVSLYEAGDKYAITTLKTTCSDWMIKNITENNCISFLDVADAHCDSKFKDTVVAYIYGHSAIFKSDTWVNFSKEHLLLANEVLQGYVVSITN